jgi:hypothetical protein
MQKKRSRGKLEGGNAGKMELEWDGEVMDTLGNGIFALFNYRFV